jgi:dolichol-phosphate mannosyltransferase
LNSSNSPEKRPTIIVGIPAYNEAKFIAAIVEKASKFANKIVVVDDGSTDDTAKIAEAAGAKVIKHGCNQGAGAATRSCFQAAKDQDADVLVTIDGDNQHDPLEIPKITAPILSNKADIVIGSRFLSEQQNMPTYRRFGIEVIKWFFNLWSNNKISDTQSCFRAYGRKALYTLTINECGYGFSIELLEQARQYKYAIDEVPIQCHYHLDAHSINPIIHGLIILLKLFYFRSKSALHRLTR